MSRNGGGYWSLLRRNGDFRRLYAAALISLAGDWFLTVALLDLVLELSHSASLASIIIVCQTLPAFLATPHAGHLIDRLDRKKVMIVVDLLRCGAALLPLLAHSAETLIFAYLGVVLISMGVAYFDPAAQAALPNMVSEEDLATANVLIGSTWGTMLAVGAALGGLVTMRFGRNVAFVVDAASFLVSALLVWGIRAGFSENRSEASEHPSFFQSLRETIHYARQHPRVLALGTSKGGFGIGGGVVAMLSIFGKEVFHAGAEGIGILYAARGLGALIGPFLIRWISSTDDSQYRKIGYCGALFAIGYTGLALSPTLGLAALLVGMAHLGGGAQWLTSTYGLQREVPDRIRGRVFAADYGFVTLTMAISGLASGLMADRFGPTKATITLTILCLAWSVIWSLRTRHLWRPNQPHGASTTE